MSYELLYAGEIDFGQSSNLVRELRACTSISGGLAF